MLRKLILLSILSIFFLIGGLSNSGILHKEAVAHSALPVVGNSDFRSEATQPELIPVTGKPRFGGEVLLVYGLIGLAALILILALLASANPSTAFYARHKISQNEDQNE